MASESLARFARSRGLPVLFGEFSDRGLADKEAERLRREQERAATQSQLTAGELLGGQAGPFLPSLLDPETGRTKPFAEQDPNVQAGILGRALQQPGTAALAQQQLGQALPEAPLGKVGQQAFDINAANEQRAAAQEARQAEIFGIDKRLKQLQLKAAQTPAVVPLTAAAVDSVLATTTALNTLTAVQKITDKHGRVGFINAMADPASAGFMKRFQEIDAVSLLKTLAGDSGALTETDIQRYQQFAGMSVFDALVTGGEQFKAILESLVQDIGRIHSTNLALYGDRLPPSAFEMVNFGDLPGGVPFDPGPPPLNAPAPGGSFLGVQGSFFGPE